MNDRERIATRLANAELLESRLIDVEDGAKRSLVNHNRRAHRVSGFDSLTGNYGVYAGPNPEGSRWLIDVDIDDYDNDTDTDALAEVNDLPDTFTVASPHTDGQTGGHRYYYVAGDSVHETLEAATGSKNPNLSWGEIRVHNQYVVGPGSQLDGCGKEWCDECATADGGYYTIATDAPIAEISPAELIQVVKADASGTEATHTPRETTRVETTTDTPSDDGTTTQAEQVADEIPSIRSYLKTGSDDRSESDYHVCCELAKRQVPEAQVYRLLANNPNSKVAAEDAARDYWSRTWQRAQQSVDTDSDSEPTESKELHPAAIRARAGVGEDGSVSDLTDREKAAYLWELLKQSPAHHVRVQRENGALWAYDDGIWTQSGERELRHAARKGLGPTAFGSNVLKQLKEQARGDPEAEITTDMLGVTPGTVAVENGLVDLEAAATGAGQDAVRPLQPEDYALTRLPVEYDPAAQADRWHEYVHEWTEDGRTAALQEYVGYCLHVGAMPIHRALLLVGSGANGKSTFLAVIRALLGGEDNTSSIELQTLSNEKDAVADFYGNLANIDDDLSARKLGNGLGMFKKLVGGDRVRARHLYQDGFEYEPTGKHLYAANEVPEVNVPDDDDAFWRRWLLVVFPNHYPPSERDPELESQFTTPDALAGVLNWAIEGWHRLLQQHHFTDELSSAHGKRERWQAWGESVDRFISECVSRDPDAPRLTTKEAHDRYEAWCRVNDLSPVGQREFTNTLKQEDVEYKRSLRVNGEVQRGYDALGLSDAVPPIHETPDHEETTSQQESLM